MSIIVNITTNDFKAIYTTINNINHSGICKYSKSILFHHGISLRLEASATKTTKFVIDDVKISSEADRLGLSEDEYKKKIKKEVYDKKVTTLMERYGISFQEAVNRVDDEEDAKIERLMKGFIKYKQKLGKNIDSVNIDDPEFETYCIEKGEGTEGLYTEIYTVTNMTVPYIQYSFDAAKTGNAESGRFGMNFDEIDHLGDIDELKRLFKTYSETKEFADSVNYIGDIMKEELKIKVE